MCYKDKTFCIKSDECKTECDRRLTEDDKSIAEKLDLFVSYANLERDCGKFEPKEKQCLEN